MRSMAAARAMSSSRAPPSPSISRWRKSGFPISSARRLFVATPEMLGEADKLPEPSSRRHRVTRARYRADLAVAAAARRRQRLRLIILGGEACPPSIASRWCRPGRKIFNSYGPTETTVVATVAEVRPAQPVTIGRPIPNYTCYVGGREPRSSVRPAWKASF